MTVQVTWPLTPFRRSPNVLYQDDRLFYEPARGVVRVAQIFQNSGGAGETRVQIEWPNTSFSVVYADELSWTEA